MSPRSPSSPPTPRVFALTEDEWKRLNKTPVTFRKMRELASSRHHDYNPNYLGPDEWEMVVMLEAARKDTFNPDQEIAETARIYALKRLALGAAVLPRKADGSAPTKNDVLAAAAVHPLIRGEVVPEFDRESFLLRLVGTTRRPAPAPFPSTATNPIPSPFLTEGEAAAYLRIGTVTLRSLRLKGAGPVHHDFGRVVYQLADLEAWSEGRRRRSTSDTSAR